jgi:peptide/nickel transport system substrate-binding protein
MLAEWSIAFKRAAMRRLLALLLLPMLAMAASSCRQQPQGTVRTLVIGDPPELRDPGSGALGTGDAVLLQNVAQGLVSFDAGGNIIGGLAERWNVSDDGLSYIFRLASAEWPDGKKVTAQQVARILKRQLAERSRNPLRDSLGAVEDVVAMTDRVIEIQLVAPRPSLLTLLAQPEMSILREGDGTGPFRAERTGKEWKLTREILGNDDEPVTREEVMLSGAAVPQAAAAFVNGKADLVLGGTFADLPLVRRIKLPRNALRFDPAAGLFGLVPAHAGGPLDKPEVRRLLAQSIDRANFLAALAVPGLSARATLLEPGLADVPAPVSPGWFTTPLGDRLAGLRSDSNRLFGNQKPSVRVALPEGAGGDLLLQELTRDWGMIGLTVERASSPAAADFILIDEVAPSISAAWFARRFRCGAVAICDAEADELMNAARETPVPAQRYALLFQAAARIDDAQLFIPITAPVRWSLVSDRIQGFAGNRYASHTLSDLQQQPNGE